MPARRDPRWRTASVAVPMFLALTCLAVCLAVCLVALFIACSLAERVGDRPPGPAYQGSVPQWFEEQRKDPNWGFESGAQEWITPAQRYGGFGSRGRYN